MLRTQQKLESMCIPNKRSMKRRNKKMNLDIHLPDCRLREVDYKDKADKLLIEMQEDERYSKMLDQRAIIASKVRYLKTDEKIKIFEIFINEIDSRLTLMEENSSSEDDNDDCLDTFKSVYRIYDKKTYLLYGESPDEVMPCLEKCIQILDVKIEEQNRLKEKIPK